MKFNFNFPSHDGIINSLMQERNFYLLNEYVKKPLIVNNHEKYKCSKHTPKGIIIDKLKNIPQNTTSLLIKQLNIILLNCMDYDQYTFLMFEPHSKEVGYINISINDSHDFIIHFVDSYCSDYDLLNAICKEIDNVFHDHLVYLDTTEIQWFFLKQQQLQKIDIEEPLYEHIYDSFYPSLTHSQSLKDFINDYIDDKASVLLLYGPPGTGKTTLIRYICSHATGTVYYTNDSKVMEHSDFFMNFLTDNDSQFLVLEDIDIHLESREKGNSFMYQLLGTADGFIRNRNKKIIISSNINDVSNVDSALLRDGRCWGQFKIGDLTFEQATKVLNDLNKSQIDLTPQVKYTLSKLFAMK